MKDDAAGGYQRIYEDLVRSLADTDVAASAGNLGLSVTGGGEAAVPFFGKTYLLSRQGVRRPDGHRVPEAIGSVLIRYIQKGSRSRPGGEFVTLAQLAGPLFRQESYSQSALERPVVRRFQGRVPELMAAAETVGGRPGGSAGLGAVSLIFELLPRIPLQLIFYDRDEEFPARATLLFDCNATQLIDFESLAVLITGFIQCLTTR